jgi:hypothetical protein
MQKTTEGTYHNVDIRDNVVEIAGLLGYHLKISDYDRRRLSDDESSRGKGSDDGEESHGCGFVNDGDDVESLRENG